VQVRRYRVGGWPDEWCELRVVVGQPDLAELARWLVDYARAHREDPTLAIDCETNGLDPFERGFATRCVQVSDGLTAWAVPLEPLTPGQVQHLAELVQAYPRWAAHYAEADERFLCRGLGLDWDPVRWSDPEPHFWDTQVALGVYDPRTVTTQNPKDRIDRRIPRPKGLKPTTTRLLTPALAQAEAAMNAWFAANAPKGHRAGPTRQRAWGFANAPWDLPEYLLYALLDPLCTARLYRLTRRELEARGQWPRTEAALAEQWVVDGATYRGMRVDEPYARWLRGELLAVTESQRPVLAPLGIGPSGMGPKVGEAFAALGVRSPVVDRDSGQESWNKDALAAIRERGQSWLVDYAQGRVAEDPDTMERVARAVQLAGAVITTRRADKYRSTWVEPMVWACERADGASHASMRAVGTVTTRMSCQKTPTAGPLHSAPKREETRLRACYRAERGRVFVSADLRQGEPHVMAALSGCPDYLAWLLEGDINGRLAAELYPGYDPAEGKVGGTPSYQRRQDVKFAWLAACYGARDAKVDALLGLPGSGVLGRWRGQFPRFWAYAEEMNERYVVHLDSGHRVPLWDRFWVDDSGELRHRTDGAGNPLPSRLGLNAATQGTQSDVLRVAVHRHRYAGWHWALRFFLHDELVSVVPAPMAEDYRAFLERAMTVTYRGVVISAEAEVCGPTWVPQVGGFDAADLASVDEAEEAV